MGRLLKALLRQMSGDEENDRVALYIPDPTCDHLMRKMGASVMTNDDLKVFSGVDKEGVANEFGIKDGDALIKLNENDACHMSTDEIHKLMCERTDLKMVVKRHEERYVEDTSGGVVKKMVETIELNDQAFEDACIFRGESAQMRRRYRKNPNKTNNSTRPPNSTYAHNHDVINQSDYRSDDAIVYGADSEHHPTETDSGFSNWITASKDDTLVAQCKNDKQGARRRTRERCSIYYEILIPIGQISRPILRRLASRLWQGITGQIQYIDTTRGKLKNYRYSERVIEGRYYNFANAYLETNGEIVKSSTSHDEEELLVSEYYFCYGGREWVAVMIKFHHYPRDLYLCCNVNGRSNDPVLYLDPCENRVEPECAASSKDDRLFFKLRAPDGDRNWYQSTTVENAYLCMGETYLDICITKSPKEFKNHVEFNMVP